MQSAKIENGLSLHSQREKDTGILVLTSDTQQEVVIKVGLPVEVCVGVVGLMTKKRAKVWKGKNRGINYHYGLFGGWRNHHTHSQ